MPFDSGTYTITADAPVAIVQQSARFNGLLVNIGAEVVYVGPEDVTPADGFPLAPGETLEAGVPVSSLLYAITAAGTTELRWLTVA